MKRKTHSLKSGKQTKHVMCKTLNGTNHIRKPNWHLDDVFLNLNDLGKQKIYKLHLENKNNLSIYNKRKSLKSILLMLTKLITEQNSKNTWDQKTIYSKRDKRLRFFVKFVWLVNIHRFFYQNIHI